MDTWTRRKFLTASGVVAGGALAAGGTTITLSHLLGAAHDNPLPSDASVLVLVTLYGGNDGLNTVVPAADPAYGRARPDLAYAEHEVLPLGDGLGLNPAMTGLKALWDSEKLAIVRGVSYPTPDHSHFRSMAIWQTGSPQASVPTGWLGRWLDATGADPLRAVSIGATLPPLLAGEKVAGSALPLGTVEPPPAALRTSLSELAKPQPGEAELQARAAASIGDMLTVDTAFSQLTAPSIGDGDDDATADGASAGGQSDLGAQLAVVAKAITAGAPTRAYSVSLGGFDTHANEKGTQSRLLGVLDKAVAGFLQQIRGTDVGRRVVLAIYSEFGRRVAANANEGTDHGTAGPVLIAGEPVRGGFIGDQPSLTDLTDGDLKVTTDFRDIYATLLEKVLGADVGKVLPGYRGRAAFI
jgi:uncharacterized protein (DUF1501 family)